MRDHERPECVGSFSAVGYFVYYKAENGFLHVLAFWHARREKQPVL